MEHDEVGWGGDVSVSGLKPALTAPWMCAAKYDSKLKADLLTSTP